MYEERTYQTKEGNKLPVKKIRMRRNNVWEMKGNAYVGKKKKKYFLTFHMSNHLIDMTSIEA